MRGRGADRRLLRPTGPRSRPGRPDRGRPAARRGRRPGRPAHRHRDSARRAVRHGGRRVPDPGAERVRRPGRRRVGARHRRDALRATSPPAGLLPWLRRPAPPRYWAKVVAAVQGVVLAVVAADLLPAPSSRVAVAGALWRCWWSRSAGTCWWQWRHRRDTRSGARSRARPRRRLPSPPWRWRWSGSPWSLPDRLQELTPGAFLRLPLEGIAAGRAGPRAAGSATSVGGLGVRAAAGDPGRGEGARHGLPRRARPAVQPGHRLGLLRARDRGAGRLGRTDRWRS